MPDPEDFGERAATEDEVSDWTNMVRAGRVASRGYRQRGPEDADNDRMRPIYGSGRASSQGDE